MEHPTGDAVTAATAATAPAAAPATDGAASAAPAASPALSSLLTSLTSSLSRLLPQQQAMVAAANAAPATAAVPPVGAAAPVSSYSLPTAVAPSEYSAGSAPYGSAPPPSSYYAPSSQYPPPSTHSPSPSPSSSLNSHTVFVGGLFLNVGREAVERCFARVGNVVDVDMKKGFCFVTCKWHHVHDSNVYVALVRCGRYCAHLLIALACFWTFVLPLVVHSRQHGDCRKSDRAW